MGSSTKKNILVFPGLRKNSGTGNLIRMHSLSLFLSKNINDLSISFYINDSARFREIYPGSFDFPYYTDVNDQYFDLCLFDSSDSDESLLSYIKAHSNKIIAFDYFNYSTDKIDCIINLISHNKFEIDKFRGKIHEGAEYAIMRDEFLTAFNLPVHRSGMPGKRILITFGGEDPGSNTFSVLKRLEGSCFTDITVLVGKLNKDREKIHSIYKEKFIVLDHVSDIVKYYSNSDIVICGGGTTFLEVLFAGIPVIPVPQNINEKNFIEKTGKVIQLFTIDDLLSGSITDVEKAVKEYRNIVDGKGKERICKIVSSWLK